MSDKQFFGSYVESFNNLYTYDEEIIYIKDNESKFCGVSQGLLKLFNLSDSTAILGKAGAALRYPLGISNMERQFNEQDQQVKSKKKSMVYLDILEYPDGVIPLVVKKFPIINPQTNNVVGLRAQISDLVIPNIIKLLFKVHGIKGLLFNHKYKKFDFDEYQLNDMQHMVLFLCINNYSYSEISLLLCSFGHEITPNRVNDFIDQLKTIFRVNTKTQLAEKAIGLDFHTFLPRSLLKFSTLEIGDQALSIVGGI